MTVHKVYTCLHGCIHAYINGFTIVDKMLEVKHKLSKLSETMELHKTKEDSVRDKPFILLIINVQR